MFSRKPRQITNGAAAVYLIVSLLLLSPALVGCDNALTEEPTSFTGPDNFYRSSEDARSALAGAYNQINQGTFGGYIGSYQFIRMTDKPTAEYTGLGDHVNIIDQWQWGPASSERNVLPQAWDGAYQGINAANAVIGNVPGIENMDPQTKTRMVAEARFLRDLHYYHLVGLFGGVPLVREETRSLSGLERPRAPEDSVYIFLIDDLRQAIEDLPADNEQGRATKTAAQMLLAKVYLQRGSLNASNGLPSERQIARPGDFQQAADLAQGVIDSGKYTLPEDVVEQYNDLFFEEVSGGANPEIIFALQQTPGKGANPIGALPFLCASDISGPPLVASVSNSAGQGSRLLWESFSEDDQRKAVTFLVETPSQSGETIVYDPDDWENDGYKEDVPVIRKYVKQAIPGDAFTEDNDYVMMRYAELLLIKAEALNEANSGPTGGAYDAINQVRGRAGLEPLSGLSYQEFREAVYTERRKELVMEGHGWFTLQRFWDIGTRRVLESAELDAQYPPSTNFGPQLDELEIDDPKDRLWPIPTAIMSRNPELTQNPGY